MENIVREDVTRCLGKRYKVKDWDWSSNVDDLRRFDRMAQKLMQLRMNVLRCDSELGKVEFD